ncbi:MAG: 50S ribosomal protein L44 [Hadesarchaea archaeon YNP_N21]|jgi:large subunit ribosomal protein L44e|nr:MAG: 50S ribosomal protein L44 [Hadesarchaea archaeon YNP_N21]
MKVPKKIRTYCPSCKKHTEHTIHQLKKRGPRALSWGQRQFARVSSGYGSQPRSEQKKFAKTTKKVSLILTCKECGKSHPREGFRSKGIKIEE